MKRIIFLILFFLSFSFFWFLSNSLVFSSSGYYTLNNGFLWVGGIGGDIDTLKVDPTGNGNYTEDLIQGTIDLQLVYGGQFVWGFNPNVTWTKTDNTIRVSNVKFLANGVEVATGTFTITLTNNELQLDYSVDIKKDGEYKEIGFYAQFPWKKQGYYNRETKKDVDQNGNPLNSRSPILFSHHFAEGGLYLPTEQLKRKDWIQTRCIGNWLEAVGESYNLRFNWLSRNLPGWKSHPCLNLRMTDEMIKYGFLSPTYNLVLGQNIQERISLQILPKQDFPPNLPSFFASDPLINKWLNSFFYERAFSLPPIPFHTTDYVEIDALETVWFETPLKNYLKEDLLNIGQSEEGYVNIIPWNHPHPEDWPWPSREDCLAQGKFCDLRHASTNSIFILANRRYYLWTKDQEFLNQNLPRIRKAMDFLLIKLKGNTGFLDTSYFPEDPSVIRGVNSTPRNWYDILPFGPKDAYSTIYFYAALQAMAEIEQAVGNNSTKDYYLNLASQVKQNFNRKTNDNPPGFWNDGAGRYVGSIDINGGVHDFGFTWINLEAIVYGLATDVRASQIINWLETGSSDQDIGGNSRIYKYPFAPRLTTKNNQNWYFWLWPPTQSPFGGNHVENGGTVLAASFYDILARLKSRGPENAYSRLLSVINRYKEPDKLSGGNPLYHGEISMGAETGGGEVGVDQEFIESGLVPLSFLYGFLGVEAKIDGLHIKPNLPSSLSYAGVDNLSWQGNLYKITASKETAQSYSKWGEGKYEIVVKNGEEFIIPFGQTPPISFSLSPGWNEITWPEVSGYTAKTALEDIDNDCGAGTGIAIAKKEKDWWEGYLKNYGGKNFNLQNNQIYFINVSKACNWVP